MNSHLQNAGYDLTGKHIVWVNDDRMYLNGKDFEMLDKETWESSPYASVYKYSHDIAPAKAGLGAKGCTDCHSFSANLFYSQVVKYPFSADGNPVFEAQHKRLGMISFFVWLSVIREQFVKAFEYPAIMFLLLTIILSLVIYINAKTQHFLVSSRQLWIFYSLFVIGFALVFLKPDLNSYILPERQWLDKNHFTITMFALIIGIFTWLNIRKSGNSESLLSRLQLIFIGIAAISGFLMVIKFEAIEYLVKISYTLFDVSIVLSVIISIIYFVENQFINLNQTSNEKPSSGNADD